jgi:hypothetical protein
MQISEQQSSALQEHHRAWSSLLQLLASEDRDGVYEEVVDANGEQNLDEYRSQPKTEDETYNSTKDVITTGLSSLNSQYVGPIGVGTITECPSSMLNQSDGVSKEDNAKCQAKDQSKVWVVFDTGSTNIWINSVLCETGPCRLPGRHMYNHSASETFAVPEVENHVSVQFGTGKIEGPQARDDFHIGPFTVKDQIFSMIENATGSVFNEVAFEGIVGLAFPKMSANGVVPFFDTVISQKALDHNEFAFYLSKDNPSANAIFWGGVDKTFYKGELEYFPVVDPFYWSLKLVSFKQYMASNGKGKDSTCSPAFMPVDLPEEHGPGMILGEVFLRHYFALFDRGNGDAQNARVALAEAADHDSVHTRLHHLTRGQPSFGDAKAQNQNPQ